MCKHNENEENIIVEITIEENVISTSENEPEVRKEKLEEDTIPSLTLPEPQYAFFNDISAFCFSQQGESHVKKETPCQDRSGMRIINDKIILAAIADGVGSCVLSDYGAETAVNSGLSFLEEHFTSEMQQEDFVFDDPVKMGKALRDMMCFAYDSVERKAAELEQLHYSFQSTLTVAVYDGQTLYFAHAGDDGIVALNKEGTYAMATSRHKGDEASSVYPLQSQNTWQFGKVEDTVGFVMATDGVLDAFVRPGVENNRVYYPFIEPVFYNVQKSEDDAKTVCNDWYEYMASESYRKNVTDDLSFVGIVNQAAIAEAEKPEFDIEEWEKTTKEYQEKRRAALYPKEEEKDAVKKKGERVLEIIFEIKRKNNQMNNKKSDDKEDNPQ